MPISILQGKEEDLSIVYLLWNTYGNWIPIVRQEEVELLRD